MNENLDLTKILKNCPKGTEFYSSVHGKLKYLSMYVSSSASEISFEDDNSRNIIDGTHTIINFYRNGRLYFTKGECIIFPSKDQRDWSKWKCPKPKKPKFDPKMLKPFDRVLVRGQVGLWSPALFTYLCDVPPRKELMMDNLVAKYVIPYNDDTKHLVGTTDEAPEFYKYWED